MRKKFVYINEDFSRKQEEMEADGWIMEGSPRSVHHIQYAVFVPLGAQIPPSTDQSHPSP